MAPLPVKYMLSSICLMNANLAAWQAQKAPGSRDKEIRCIFSSSGSQNTVSPPLQKQTGLQSSRERQWGWQGAMPAQVNLSFGAQSVYQPDKWLKRGSLGHGGCISHGRVRILLSSRSRMGRSHFNKVVYVGFLFLNFSFLKFEDLHCFHL